MSLLYSIHYTYDALGQKRGKSIVTLKSVVDVPMGQLHSALADEIKTNRNIYYCSNLELAGLTKIGLFMVHIPDGYILSADLVFQITDHLGNVCAETGSGGHEIATYYPSGIRVDNSATYLNSDYVFANKEFQSSHRLNLYDFGERYYEMHLSHWTTMDPLCEKYYWLSPYSYCGGNPVNRIDPTGADWYEDESGNVFWREGSDEIEGYTNIGPNYEMQNNYITYAYIQNDLTSITYSGISAKDWVSQMQQGINCYKASEKMLNKVNVQTVGRGQEIIIVRKGTNGRAGEGGNNLELGISTINSALINGKPIMVGVDYKDGSPNADGMTDHFVVVSSLTENIKEGSVASVYYNFFDPGTYSLSKGTDLKNMFYITNNQLKGNYQVLKDYIVVTVRRNK